MGDRFKAIVKFPTQYRYCTNTDSQTWREVYCNLSQAKIGERYAAKQTAKSGERYTAMQTAKSTTRFKLNVFRNLERVKS